MAGSFYSADPQELSSQIKSFIDQAAANPSEDPIEAMISPHAGYAYSGPVAGFGYRAIANNHYSTIVVMGPSHYFPFDGISVWTEGEFRTPLGSLKVDEDLAKQLLDPASGFNFTPAVYQKEHSIEVQLPFIQRTFGDDVKIVPILMGNPDPKVCQQLAVRLNKIIGSREDVLVIASSDMSHYFSYDVGNAMDDLTLKTIDKGDVQEFWAGNLSRKMEMCGFVPVATLMLYAHQRGLKMKILTHANSGDTAGDKSRVVGYASIIYYKEPAEEITADEKKELLKLARDTLTSFVTTGKVPDHQTEDTRLLKTQGAFVTLKKQGGLRGCIGNIMGDKPLWQTIKEMTVAAASKDSRFSAVSKEELPLLDLEISVLSVPQQVSDASAIVLGRDGVIVSDGNLHQGVFLPQVASETNWSKDQFLAELCSQKAGLPADCWKDPKISLFTFHAEVFAE